MCAAYFDENVDEQAASAGEEEASWSEQEEDEEGDKEDPYGDPDSLEPNVDATGSRLVSRVPSVRGPDGTGARAQQPQARQKASRRPAQGGVAASGQPTITRDSAPSSKGRSTRARSKDSAKLQPPAPVSSGK